MWKCLFLTRRDIVLLIPTVSDSKSKKRRERNELHWNIKWGKDNVPFQQRLILLFFFFFHFSWVRTANISANKLFLFLLNYHEKQCSTELAFCMKYGELEDVYHPKTYSKTTVIQIHWKEVKNSKFSYLICYYPRLRIFYIAKLFPCLQVSQPLKFH